ncbi:MAG: hypothetical protein MK160_08945, partial [Rhodobacteraceae bacterium]|nr:hypothetical protein [Paracoccaceae bacterium]
MSPQKLLFWTPFAVLTLAAAMFGFQYGWIVWHSTETDVINRFAASYVAQTGAPATDCRALPGENEHIWLVVICGPVPFNPTQQYEYHVNRLGALVHFEGPQAP